MELTQAVLSMIASFFLGVSLTIFVLWLIFIGIPKFIFKKEERFEERVKAVVKKNYDKSMNVSKEFLKDLIKEVQNDKTN